VLRCTFIFFVNILFDFTVGQACDLRGTLVSPSWRDGQCEYYCKTRQVFCSHRLSICSNQSWFQYSSILWVDTIKMSSLFYQLEESGKTPMHLPHNQVRLLMGPNLESGIFPWNSGGKLTTPVVFQLWKICAVYARLVQRNTDQGWSLWITISSICLNHGWWSLSEDLFGDKQSHHRTILWNQSLLSGRQKSWLPCCCSCFSCHVIQFIPYNNHMANTMIINARKIKHV